MSLKYGPYPNKDSTSFPSPQHSTSQRTSAVLLTNLMFEYLITFTIKNFILLISLFLVTQYFALYRSVRHEGGIVQTKYQIHWAPEFYSKKEREAAVLIVQERRRQEERQRLRQSSEERDTPPAYSGRGRLSRRHYTTTTDTTIIYEVSFIVPLIQIRAVRGSGRLRVILQRTHSTVYQRGSISIIWQILRPNDSVVDSADTFNIPPDDPGTVFSEGSTRIPTPHYSEPQQQVPIPMRILTPTPSDYQQPIAPPRTGRFQQFSRAFRRRPSQDRRVHRPSRPRSDSD